MGMKQDLKAPREGGLSAKEFLQDYGISKSKAIKTNPRIAMGMNKGGLPKKNFAKPGSYSKRK